MAKSEWGKPGYQGRPDPQISANKIMIIIVVLLTLGFIQAGIKHKWFTTAYDYVLSQIYSNT